MWLGTRSVVRRDHSEPRVTVRGWPVLMARSWHRRELACSRTGGVRVSRRVGELVSEQAEGGGQGGAPHALNDLAPRPRPATPWAPTGRDTRAPGDPTPYLGRSWNPSRSGGPAEAPGVKSLVERCRPA